MKRTVGIFFVGLCVVSALSVAGDENKSKPSVTTGPVQQFDTSPSASTNGTTAQPNTTTIKPNATTIKPNATTIKPQTTTIKPNTTTIHPNTTTIHPNTTTIHPNTTTIHPNTTTIKPKTTTIKPDPPTPKPTPSTNLTVGNYNVTDQKGLCLMAQMAVQIRVASPKTNGTFIVQPKLTTAQGDCKETTANLTLAFKEGFITFMFNKSVAENTVYVDTLSFSLSYPFSKGGNDKYTATNKSVHLFAAKVGHSYSCKNESLFMGNGLYLDVSQDRMQAFNLSESKEFGSTDLCAADQPDYRVAIAVGVILLVLIVIVVLAYLLSRKRRADGYQSL